VLLTFFRENSNWANIGQKCQAVDCDLVLLLGGTPLGENLASIFARNRTAPNEIRSPDRPVRSESLYEKSYPGLKIEDHEQLFY
jgi:hypothetical protein